MISVLYVDDEPGLLDIAKRYLEESDDFSVITIDSALPALELLKKEPFDAIISDYQMPGMDGITFLKKLKASGNTTPFIIFTGRGREEVVIEALNNGADFYIQKGGEPTAQFTELSNKIRYAVSRRRAEEALAEQEQRYHDLQNANDLIQSVAPDGHFLFVNKKWLDTLGYQEQELPNLTIFDVIHEESLKHCMETFHRVISGENVGIIDAVFKTRNGKSVYVEGMATCRMVDGKPQYTRGLFKDVTDRKLAEAALKESEARYRNVVEDQTEFISRFRPDGTHVFVNDAYCRYYHKKREEIIGKRFFTDIPTEDRALVRQHFASLTREHPVAPASNRVILEDGRIRWQQWSNRAIFDDDGHILEYQSVGRDITDLKEAEHELLRKNEEINAAFEEITATEEELRHNYDLLSLKEQALRESEEKFRTLVEHSLDGILIIDFMGILLFANQAASRIVDAADYLGMIGKKNILEFVAPESRAEVLKDFSQVMQGIDAYLVHYKLITEAKREIWVECIGKKITFKETAAMLVSLRDITERRKTEFAVEESEKKFRTIFEDSPYPISINSIPDGKFIAINAAFLQSSGYSEAEVLGKSPVELGLLSLMDFGKLTSHLLVSGRLENVPMVLMGKGGNRVHVQFSTIPVTINERPAIMTMTAEITKLKRVEEELQRKNEELSAAFEELTASEEELRQNYDQLAAFQKTIQESEARFRTLFKISPEGIILFDITGRITFASPEALRMFQVSSMDEAVGTSVFDWVEPEYHEMVREAMVQLLDGKVRRAITYRVRRRDGSSFFVETSQGIFPDANGRPDGFMVIIRDITDRQHADMALRESEDRYRTLVEKANEAIFVIQDGRICFANPKLMEIGNYTLEELAQKPFLEFVHPDDRLMVGEQHKRRLNGEILKDNYVFRVVSKEGSLRWMEINASLITWNGRPAIIVLLSDITERRKVEGALRESEEKLALVMNGVPTLLAYMDPELRFVYMNKAHTEWYGRAEEELIGKSLKELLPEEVFLRALPYWQQVLSGREANFENSTRDRDGRERVLTVRLVPHVRGEQVVGFFAALDDVTERKRAEEALRESEEKFRSLVEYALEGILILDFQGKTLFANNAAARTIEVDSYAELIGRNVMEFIAPESQKDVIRDFIQIAQGHDAYLAHYHVISAKGKKIYVESIGKVITYEGKPADLISIRDITEQKKAEDALRESEERFRTILNSLQSGIVIIDAQTHTILDANPKALEMIGGTSESVLGSVCHRFICPSESGKCPATDLGQTLESSERVLLTQRGERIPILKSVIKTILGGKEVLIESFVDITEWKRAEEALQQANKKLSLLSGITRHDINNQLLSLNGFLELLHKKIPNPSFEDYFTQITNASSRITAMIKFTKEYEKIGVRAPVWQDLQTLVNRAGKDVPLGRVTLKNDLPAGTEVFADPLIVKVFFNLIDNAVRHGEKITTIRFSFEGCNWDRILVCEDDGAGVIAEEKEKIFERGFGKNTGFGLALSREILDITHITIKERGKPGAGARFEIKVPKNMWRIAEAGGRGN